MIRRRKIARAEKDNFLWHAILRAGLAGTFALLIGACGQGEAPKAELPAKKEEQAKADKKTKPDAAKPEQKAEAQYVYDSAGKPDPFVPLITEETSAKSAAPQRSTTPMTPLQKYDLNELKLVAIVAKAMSMTAVLEDPAGFGYIVKEGTLVGKNDGVIKKITGDSLVVEEQIFSTLGNLEPKISTLTIQHEK